MRHLVTALLRLVMRADDSRALLGDLEEDYRRRVRPAHGWLVAQFWYVRETISAVTSALRDRTHLRLPRLALLADVRYALRRWRRRPGFAIAAVLTLGLGIGATTAIFSVIDAVVLRPLPYPEADRLFRIYATRPERRSDPRYASDWNRASVSRDAWREIERSAGPGVVGAWTGTRTTLLMRERATTVSMLPVSSGLLRLFDTRVEYGRLLTPQEDVADSGVALLTYDGWQRLFGGRADVVGSTVTFESFGGLRFRHMQRVIVGIASRGFELRGSRPDFLIPVASSVNVSMIVRLAPDMSAANTLEAIRPIVSSLMTRERFDARLVPLQEDFRPTAARPLWMLFAGAALLLCVACANVAGLILAESRHRRHEAAVRCALGCSRGRLLTQVLVEHALLGCVASAAGIFLAVWLTGGLVTLAPEDLPFLQDAGLSGRVLAFAVGTGLVSFLVFGLWPALALSRAPRGLPLNETSRHTPRGQHTAHRLIVSGALAMALVLLNGASLLGESLLRLTSQPLGFQPRNLAVASTLFADANRSGSAVPVDDVIRDLASLPGVEHAAAALTPPFSGNQWVSTGIGISNGTMPERPVRINYVTTNYFETMGMVIVRGRGFERGDDTSVTVVSREFQRRFLEGSPLGASILRSGDPPRRIVGVVADVHIGGYREGPEPMFYSLDSTSYGAVQFIVRTAGAPTLVLPPMRRIIEDTDARWVVESTDTMESLMSDSAAHERFRATLSWQFGATALLLAAIGLFALTTRRAVERAREFALRVALGAGPSDVRALVLRDACWVVGFGLAAGLPAAYATSQFTVAYLYEVSPTSPHTFALASAVLATAAIVATVLPARRASRRDPVEALRH